MAGRESGARRLVVRPLGRKPRLRDRRGHPGADRRGSGSLARVHPARRARAGSGRRAAGGVMLVGDAPIGAPTAEAVMERARGENFPVASRLLGRRLRSHLLAIYGFARLVDELGDAAPGDRLAALDWLEQDLERAFTGRAEHPLLARLAPTLRECGLPRGPFLRLIEANRLDQRVNRYQT